ncbi:hypothetical protein ABW21_db0204594 [Orbilia brochopaga]|nr:hypothetical protein ABW21_db0204594 [Drechslerella brochopaga]
MGLVDLSIDDPSAYLPFTISQVLSLGDNDPVLLSKPPKDDFVPDYPARFYRLPILLGINDRNCDPSLFWHSRGIYIRAHTTVDLGCYRVVKSDHGRVAASEAAQNAFRSVLVKDAGLLLFVAATPIFAFDERKKLITPPLAHYSSASATSAPCYAVPGCEQHLDDLPYPSAWEHSPRDKNVALPILTSPQPAPPVAERMSRLPSLVELCLRTIAKTAADVSSPAERAEFLSSVSMASAEMPDNLRKRVSAITSTTDPAQLLKTCSVCANQYVTVGAEWVEFWQLRPCREPENGMELRNFQERPYPSLLPYWEYGLEHIMHSTAMKLLEREPEVIAMREEARFGFMYGSIPGDPVTDVGREVARNRGRQLLQRITAVSEVGDRFVKRYVSSSTTLLSELGGVAPFLRQTCSWDCAASWMAGWDGTRDDEETEMTEDRRYDGKDTTNGFGYH